MTESWYDYFFVSNRSLLLRILENQEIIMADTQATLAKLAAATQSLAGIRQDIVDLKALIASGGTPQEVSDAVDALAAGLAGLDAENPAPPTP
jgi:acid phosphatase family membrane protein YuiD